MLLAVGLVICIRGVSRAFFMDDPTLSRARPGGKTERDV
jgi:hypothetical protein